MTPDTRPNVLFVVCDQLRWDAIAAHGDPHVHTPNIDRLVREGASFERAYSSCPVCMPARYTIRTGCEPPRTGLYQNGAPDLVDGQPAGMEERCGPYIARRMGQLGYRTWGVGKFHTHPHPWEDTGFESKLRSEELWDTPEQRARDDYAAWLAKEHPAFAHIEQPHGERTEMYYQPQLSPLPAEATVEAWAADRAIEFLDPAKDDGRPFFGFLSFVGPHPPFAPPVPYNRLYDPDKMRNPRRGDPEIDHADEQIPWMNHLIWADELNDFAARLAWTRYYGEITYIDACLGRVLDALEARPDAANTVVVLTSDHGEHLGDHDAWQKESFFEESARIPFIVRWPAGLAAGQRPKDFAALADLFGIATRAAGSPEPREGADVLGALLGEAPPREDAVGMHGIPGTPLFKIMVRRGDWKYVFLANGGREQLFHLGDDPHEARNLVEEATDTAWAMRRRAIEACSVPNAERALDGGRLLGFPYSKRPRTRVKQFDRSRGVEDFPASPAEGLRQWAERQRIEREARGKA